jgi:hypothetical protein
LALFIDQARPKRALNNATKAKSPLFSLRGKSLVPFFRIVRSMKIDQQANAAPKMLLLQIDRCANGSCRRPKLYDLSFLDILALDGCFQVLELKAEGLPGQDLDGAKMRDVQDVRATQLMARRDSCSLQARTVSSV